MTRQSLIAAALASFLTTACGGSSPEAGAPPTAGQAIVVATSPAETDVAPDGTVKFGAQVTGTADGSVVWRVAEADGGTIDSSGLYTAPAIEGTFHVLAVSAASTKSNGTSVVRVKKGAAAQVLVAVDPATATVPAGGSKSFAAAVTGTTTRTVTWTVQGSGCGSVSATGVYTAPNAGATCTVVATSAADATKSGTAAVTVIPPPPHVVTVTPSTATVFTGGTYTFSATVTGTTAGESTAVTWSAPAGSGTINASTGVYVAPATAGTYIVTATSVAPPSGTATATVTVTPAPVIAVSVAPATPSLLTGGTVTFSATVTGTTAGQSSAVVWSVPAGSGSINASTGVYVAPATAGAYVVTATSVADGSKKGTATVTVTAPPVTIAINPTTATLDACLGQQFTATVGNSSISTVTWTITEGSSGGIVTNGAYVSPSTPGTYHVVAVSQADPTKSATATITVGPERVQSVSVTPGSGTLQANGTLAFSALVTTTCGTFAAQ